MNSVGEDWIGMWMVEKVRQAVTMEAQHKETTKECLKFVVNHVFLFLFNERLILEPQNTKEDICIIDGIHDLICIQTRLLLVVFT